MKKGTRQIRYCKFGCGRQVGENIIRGLFKGYLKTCGICKHPNSWTDESKKKLSCSMKGLKNPNALKIGTRRKKTEHGLSYWEIKVNESGRWKLEHRHLMEEKIGRLLKSDEHVHHINGNSTDNRLENLMILSHSEHSKQTMKDHGGAKKLFYPKKPHKCPVCQVLHEPPKI